MDNLMNSECFYIESLDQVQADVCDHVNECFMSIMWPQGHLYHISELLMRTTVESKGWSVESLLPPVTFIEVKNRSYFQVSVLWFTLYNMGGGEELDCFGLMYVLRKLVLWSLHFP